MEEASYQEIYLELGRAIFAKKNPLNIFKKAPIVEVQLGS